MLHGETPQAQQEAYGKMVGYVGQKGVAGSL